MDFPKLIELFAKYRVAEIGAVPEYIELCRTHAGNFQFQSQREAAERAKAQLEELLDKQPGYAAQIRQAFIKIEKLRRSQDFDLFYELIVQGYKPKWSAAQQAYFDEEVRSILSGNDFFLSFTSRSPEILGEKGINRRYRYFIRSAGQFSKADLKTKNLLAEAFLAKLRPELKGFYYLDNEYDNAKLEPKLSTGSCSCRVFVQLVENVMFVPPEDQKPNYCEFEYRRALECLQGEGRIIFVVAEEHLKDPDRVHDEYSDWLEDIRTRTAPHLPPVERYDRQKISDIEQKLEYVVSQVRAAWTRVLDGIPS
jgi:hypothetical protein